jgi:hypothetical protein
MDEKKKENLLELIGFIFAGMYLYILILFLSSGYFLGLLWICYISIPLFALGIFLKKSNLILSQALLLLIPDLLWSIDFFYRLFTGSTLIGINNFFFTTSLLSRKILSLQHVLTPILTIIALSLIKIKKISTALIISLGELLIFLFLGFLIPSKAGINCLPSYESCLFFNPAFILPYPIFWLLIESCFILVTYLILTKLKIIHSK